MIDPSIYKSPKVRHLAEALNQMNALEKRAKQAKVMWEALVKIEDLEDSKESDSERIAAAIKIAKDALKECQDA